MSGGLEEFLESLIPHIAYRGETGLSVSALLKLVKQHLNPGYAQHSNEQEDNGEDSQLSEPELATARWAWQWLKTQPDIFIQGGKARPNLDFDHVLALPEAVSDRPAKTGDGGESQQSSSQKGSSVSASVRPRIRVREELMWSSIAGHSKDHRRLPPLEWQCLVGIASAGKEGIFQSDLIRLVGQDKRSVPKRTDALATKNYAVKRSVNRHKQKTSKLWLPRFAPPSFAQKELEELDFSTENLTRDLEPVSWAHLWLVGGLDLEAFGRTFLAIAKAWGVIRYMDLKCKMGIDEKPWQMKQLSRICRRFVDAGILKYSVAAFPGNVRIWKDCIKFLRDPTPEEWRNFLATGKRTHGKQTKQLKGCSSAAHKKGGIAHDEDKDDCEAGQMENIDTQNALVPGWEPELPVMQSTFEVIQAAGSTGASIPQISAATVGYHFRRFVARAWERVARVKQPPHLEKFQVTRTMKRHGKATMYVYTASPNTGDKETPQDPANPYGFGTLPLSYGQQLGARAEKSLSALMSQKQQHRLFPAHPLQRLTTCP
ncbi:hypothetical protein P8C59_005869 [Phyllachora maydis]|uniref:B-block binding subunit of TFIIIC domain-containing protein n=1 Tax=Phyllachora maydis TaxID=1825666 RepID=A0AAD9I5P5_9PEZI|nr:hypothetical protein P8C59_005869 [Phyllachora maydis]